METRVTRWWLALAGVGQLGTAAMFASTGPTWAAVGLAIMGVITVAGGVVHAKSAQD